MIPWFTRGEVIREDLLRLAITVATVWLGKNINEFRTLPERRSRRLWIYEIESL